MSQPAIAHHCARQRALFDETRQLPFAVHARSLILERQKRHRSTALPGTVHR